MLQRLPDLPLVKQKSNYTCGAASLLCVLRFYGFRGLKESDLAKKLMTDIRFGVDSGTLAKVAKRYGLKAQCRVGLKISDLELELKKGHPVIVDFQAWRTHKEQRSPWRKIWVDGHYSVIQNMDRWHIWLMDPWIGRIVRLTHRQFLARWHTDETRSDDRPTKHRVRRSAVIIHGRADKP